MNEPSKEDWRRYNTLRTHMLNQETLASDDLDWYNEFRGKYAKPFYMKARAGTSKTLRAQLGSCGIRTVQGFNSKPK